MFRYQKKLLEASLVWALIRISWAKIVTSYGPGSPIWKKQNEGALPSVTSFSFWRYHEWSERKRDESAGDRGGATVSDGDAAGPMDGRITGVSDLPPLRHHSSQRSNPHVCHSLQYLFYSLHSTFWFSFSQRFFLLLSSGWSCNAIITFSISPKDFATSVPRFPYWTQSNSLSLSLCVLLCCWYRNFFYFNWIKRCGYAVDRGCATGSSTPLLYWENPSKMNSKITLSNFLTVVRFSTVTLILIFLALLFFFSSIICKL